MYLGKRDESPRGKRFVLALLARLERSGVSRSKICRLQTWVYEHGVHEHTKCFPGGWVSLTTKVVPLPPIRSNHMFLLSLSSSVLNVADRNSHETLPTFVVSHELGHLFGTLPYHKPEREPFEEPKPGTCSLFREEAAHIELWTFSRPSDVESVSLSHAPSVAIVPLSLGGGIHLLWLDRWLLHLLSGAVCNFFYRLAFA